MKRRVVLIKPTVSWNKKNQGCVLPLSVIFSAVHLVKDYEVTILDEIVEADVYAEISKYFNENTIAFCFSVFTGPQILHAIKLSKYIRNKTKTTIVWGGIHPSLLPVQTLKNSYIDYVVCGEGEETLFDLVRWLDGVSLKNIDTLKGIGYKNIKGEVILTQDREFIDLDSIERWPLFLVDTKKYFIDVGGRRYINFQLSRGCVKGCNYCYNKVYNRGLYRCSSLKIAIKQLDNLINYSQPEGIFFIDDSLFLNKEYVLELVKYLWDKGVYSSYLGADVCSLFCFSREDFEFLAGHGVERIHLGLESGSPRIRELIKKDGTPEEILEIAVRMNTTEIQLWCNSMINIPTETMDDLKATIKLIFKMREVNAKVFSTAFYKYLPYCGTSLFETLQGMYQGAQSLEEWSEIHCESKNSPVFADYLRDIFFYKALYISNFIFDEKIESVRTTGILNNILIILGKLYRPIAKYRLQNLDFRFGLDIWLIDKVFNVLVSQ